MPPARNVKLFLRLRVGFACQQTSPGAYVQNFVVLLRSAVIVAVDRKKWAKFNGCFIRATRPIGAKLAMAPGPLGAARSSSLSKDELRQRTRKIAQVSAFPFCAGDSRIADGLLLGVGGSVLRSSIQQACDEFGAGGNHGLWLILVG